jgi:uncharacterized membrane protein YhiD involved in acid resistance
MKQALIATLALTILATAAHAQGEPGRDKAKEKEKQKQEEKATRDRKKAAVEEILKTKDTNKDGNLSKEEYLAGEADAEAATKTFDKANKNKDRWLSKGEIASTVD